MRTFIILYLLLHCLLASAQRNTLERTITLKVENQSIETVLRLLTRKYGVSFSYSSSLVPVDRKVSLEFKSKPLSQVLDQLLVNNDINYQQFGKQIVLKRKIVVPVRQTEVMLNQVVSLSQYIPEQDYLHADFSADIKPLPVSTSHSRDTIKSSVDRNELRRRYLEQKIKLKMEYDRLRDSLNRSGNGLQPWAEDLRKAMNQLDVEFLKLEKSIRNYFRPSSDSTGSKTDSARVEFKPETNVSAEAGAETRLAPINLSLWHGLSTNGALEAKTVNLFSVGLFTSHSAGVRGAEFSSLFNDNEGSVIGVQAAGLVNHSKAGVRGVQSAGLFNYTQSGVVGAQVSGLVNVIEDGSFDGLQASGLLNLASGDARGAQLAGFANLNEGYLEGLQSAGFVNVNQGYMRGAQAAGFVNVQGDHGRGAQFAGFVNVTEGNWLGGTFAGFANVQQGDLEGVQASGFYNQASKVKGVQLGVVNIADTVDGVQIGLVNIARGNGYRRFELSAHEVMQARLSYKLGTERLYNIYQVGWHFGQEHALGIGAGWGTQWKLHNKLSQSFELIASFISRKKDPFERFHMINALQYQVIVPLSTKLSLQAGPTLQMEVTERKNSEQSFFSVIPSTGVPYQNTNGNTRYSFWPGFKIGISF